MTPRIVRLEAKTLVGISTKMSLGENRTYQLWNGFMKLRHQIAHQVLPGLYSLQIYDEYFLKRPFTPDTIFEKWAAVEVTELARLPEGMQALNLEAGLYAVFTHKGHTSGFQHTMNYIYGIWLPASGYQLDERPHFELMGDAYLGQEHPDSEEDVYVPIKR